MGTQQNLVPIPGFADIIPIQEWLAGVELGYFNEEDGFGYWATKTHQFTDSSFTIWEDAKNPPSWATHVTWYNK